jgi:hypothetical protein
MRDLFICAKRLFSAARNVWHGLQSSRGERDEVSAMGNQA